MIKPSTHSSPERTSPVTVVPAGALTAGLGLLAEFLLLRDGQTEVNLVQFIDWLRRHDHPDLLYRIQSNPAIFGAFQAAFEEGHGELVTRLEFLDEGLILLCGSEGTMAKIAGSLRPELAIKVRSP